ncbi:MAG: acetylxylan esterase [Candidatus Symbiothrix sp.]|nr:acetylxylan esterase [Candidatus Symbiothrix sp.]
MIKIIIQTVLLFFSVSILFAQKSNKIYHKEEALALGYTNIYSPILDISRDPRWGRVVECYGEDPYLAGESRTVNFTLTPQELGLWNKHDEFVVEPGTFTVMTGSSSEEIKLTENFEVAADVSAEKEADVNSLSFRIDVADEDWIFLTPQQIEFEISLLEPVSEKNDFNLICNITTDDYKPIDSKKYPVNIEQGKNLNRQIQFAPPAPGFYRFSVYAEKNGKKSPAKKFNIGYEPEKIISPSDAKTDFEDFWKNTRAELDKVAPRYKLTLMEDKSSEIKNMYHVEMYSFGDIKIEGYYSAPKKAGKYPVIVYYMGYGANPYFPDANALPDFCEFVLSTRGQGIQKASNTYGDWLVYGLENKENYYYRGAYMDLIRGIDFVASRPEIDAEKIVVEGGSQGGAFAMTACALDKRIKAGAPHITFLSDFRDYFNICPWPRSAFEKYLRANPEKSWNDLYDKLTYFDIKNMAPYITCPIIMGVGLQDETCPPHTNFAGYNLVTSPKQYYVYPEQKHAVGKSWWKTREDFFRKILMQPIKNSK